MTWFATSIVRPELPNVAVLGVAPPTHHTSTAPARTSPVRSHSIGAYVPRSATERAARRASTTLVTFSAPTLSASPTPSARRPWPTLAPDTVGGPAAIANPIAYVASYAAAERATTAEACAPGPSPHRVVNARTNSASTGAEPLSGRAPT